MAPSKFLKRLLSDFDGVERAVTMELGRRVRLAWPCTRVLVLGRRSRLVISKRGEEESRISLFLCCPEPLKLVGSLYPADEDPVDESKNEWCPEIYVARSGKLVLYVCGPPVRSVCVVADNVDDFIKNGLKGCDGVGPLDVAGPMPPDIRALRLAYCGDLEAVVDWRESQTGAEVLLGDGTQIRICDLYFTRYVADDLDLWRQQAGVRAVEIVAVAVHLPASCPVKLGSRLVLAVDSQRCVYAVDEDFGGLVMIANDLVEFVTKGVQRYARNTVFYCDPRRRRLFRRPACPNGIDHMLRNVSAAAVRPKLVQSASADSPDLPISERRGLSFRVVTRMVSAFSPRRRQLRKNVSLDVGDPSGC
ncbi:B23 [miniopterid betaherpesvirus 1]|uniref:B23 n=1 Tax=miniopterid betaherpesvirus 1 TaxID=3070189 RepID=I3VPZ1_9BETA|nr:B23 [miniopterid betaherpesvirus 1]AFK83835.1 B23 [miniopterid betaherpesvirus 1]